MSGFVLTELAPVAQDVGVVRGGGMRWGVLRGTSFARAGFVMMVSRDEAKEVVADDR